MRNKPLTTCYVQYSNAGGKAGAIGPGRAVPAAGWSASASLPGLPRRWRFALPSLLPAPPAGRRETPAPPGSSRPTRRWPTAPAPQLGPPFLPLRGLGVRVPPNLASTNPSDRADRAVGPSSRQWPPPRRAATQRWLGTWVQDTKQSCNCTGSRRAKPSPKVSWDAIP